MQIYVIHQIWGIQRVPCEASISVGIWFIFRILTVLILGRVQETCSNSEKYMKAHGNAQVVQRVLNGLVQQGCEWSLWLKFVKHGK